MQVDQSSCLGQNEEVVNDMCRCGDSSAISACHNIPDHLLQVGYKFRSGDGRLGGGVGHLDVRLANRAARSLRPMVTAEVTPKICRLVVLIVLVATTLVGCQTAESTASLIGLAARVAGLGEGTPGSLTKTRLDRANPNFGAEMDRLRSYVGTEPVDVVIAGVPPSGDGAVRAFPDSDTSVDIDKRQTTYRQVVITKLDRDVLEIRPSATSSSRLEIPNFQVERITYTQVRVESKSTWWYWIPYGLLIALGLVAAGLILTRVASGSMPTGSGGPPIGCFTVLGIVCLAIAVVAFFSARSEVGTGVKYIYEYVNRVWLFL